jgi:hypothetical protein
MTDLTPQAQFLLNAADEVFARGGTIRDGFAAALRALDSRLGHEVLNVRCVDCSQIELIAAELEGSND